MPGTPRVSRVKLTIEFEGGDELVASTADGASYTFWGLGATVAGLSSRTEDMIKGYVQSLRDRDERAMAERKRGGIEP